MWIEPETFEPLTTTLEEFGYEPFASPGERHGSWEWPFYRKCGGLTRFVIFAATPLDSGDTLQVELWIGAEAGQRFTRNRIESFRWDVKELSKKIGTLLPSIERAVNKANTLNWSDLEEERQTLRLRAVPAR